MHNKLKAYFGRLHNKNPPSNTEDMSMSIKSITFLETRQFGSIIDN